MKIDELAKSPFFTTENTELTETTNCNKKNFSVFSVVNS